MLTTQATHQIFQKLLEDPTNRVCFECGSPSPSWASLPNAIFICYICSGVHRGMGVHLSFVRSITIDSWSQKQMDMMINGGNAKLKEFFTYYGIQFGSDMSAKYRTKAGWYYRERMRYIVDGRINEIKSQPNLQEGVEEEVPVQRVIPQQIIPDLVAQQPQYQQESTSPYTFDLMKQMFQSGLQKTADITKGTIQIVDQKITDAQIKQNLTKIQDKSKKVMQQSLKKIEKGMTNAFEFIMNKFDKQEDPQFEQQEVKIESNQPYGTMEQQHPQFMDYFQENNDQKYYQTIVPNNIENNISDQIVAQRADLLDFEEIDKSNNQKQQTNNNKIPDHIQDLFNFEDNNQPQNNDLIYFGTQSKDQPKYQNNDLFDFGELPTQKQNNLIGFQSIPKEQAQFIAQNNDLIEFDTPSQQQKQGQFNLMDL